MLYEEARKLYKQFFELSLIEPYLWLLPLQIAAAALVIVLGGANVLVWKRKRAHTC